MSTLTASASSVLSPAAAITELPAKLRDAAAERVARVNWAKIATAAIFGTASLLVITGLAALFVSVPLLFPILGSLWAAWAGYTAFRFLGGWRTARAAALATLRVSMVAATGLLVLGSLFLPTLTPFAVVTGGSVVFLLARVVCGRSGALAVARQAGEDEAIRLDLPEGS